jgi:hypothetical protein
MKRLSKIQNLIEDGSSVKSIKEENTNEDLEYITNFVEKKENIYENNDNI